MKVKISIVSAMLIILLSLSMSVSAYSQSSPMGFTIRYASIVDTSFTVTLPPGQTGMNFTGSPGNTGLDPDGQIDVIPWAKISNTGELTRNFTIALGINNPANIKLMESDVYAMTGAIELNNTPKIIVGGQNIPPSAELNVFVKADYSLVPVGTNQVFTNTGTIRNYLPVLQSITVSYSPTTTIYVGDTRTFTAIGLDQFGASMPITPIWASSNTAVATIDSSGKFKAVGAGNTNITATSGAVVGFKVVTVKSL